MSSPLVSVALATCNGARYLREQLETVYEQTWPHLEVVASDDASTDGTVEILADYAARRGLRYEVNPRRLGLVGNFARAIALCRGEYVALCDQDDLWKPHRIATLLAHLGGSTLIYCSAEEVLTTAGEQKIDTSFAGIVRFARAQGSGRPTRQLLAENWVVSHTLLFRRELVAHALPIPPHQLFHDGWLALVASKLGGIRYLDERLQVYRQHPASLTYIDPARRHAGSFHSLRALLGGRYRETWRQRCEAEIARLEDALGLPLLDADDRGFVAELITYYRSGLHRGLDWRAFASGRRIAPYVATLYGTRRAWRFALRGLIGGL